MMARAPGVGPKLAARLVLELKDKAPAADFAEHGAASVPGARRRRCRRPAEDAILALVGLGYAQAQAAAAVAEGLGASWAPKRQTATLIRAGLKALGA